MFGLPCGAETSVLVARADLLAKHGLPMPVYYDQLLAACRTLAEREGIGGLASRGQAGHHLTHAWLLHLSPHGGAVFDREWNCIVNRRGGVRATEVLREIASLAPPGMQKAGFAEMQEAFLTERAAFYLDSSSLLGVLRDARHTELVSRVRYAMHPSGTHQSGQIGGLGVGLAANAQQPEAAWLLMQWLLSPPVDLAIAMDGGVAARWSTLTDPTYRANRPEQAIMRFALRAANPDWRPLIPEWEQISSELVGRVLPSLVYDKQPIDRGMAELAASIDAALIRSGRRPARGPSAAAPASAARIPKER